MEPKGWLTGLIPRAPFASTLAIGGIAMTPLPAWTVAGTPRIPGTPHDDKAVWHDRDHPIANLEEHSTGTEPASSNSFSTSPTKNSESVSFNVSIGRKRTGN